MTKPKSSDAICGLVGFSIFSAPVVLASFAAMPFMFTQHPWIGLAIYIAGILVGIALLLRYAWAKDRKDRRSRAQP